jgi:uncharacterized membrane protein YkvA (DUF1232 family)
VTSLTSRLRAWAGLLKREVVVVALAARDPRTPFWPRAVAFLTAAYALSPIDLIPDFIPVLGLLDDLILVPAGIALVIRLLPPDLLTEFRAEAARIGRLPKSLAGALLVAGLWIALAVAVGFLVWSRVSHPRR